MRVFYYKFDNRDFLQKITMEFNGNEEIIFEREKEILQAKKDYYKNNSIIDNVG